MNDPTAWFEKFKAMHKDLGEVLEPALSPHIDSLLGELVQEAFQSIKRLSEINISDGDKEIEVKRFGLGWEVCYQSDHLNITGVHLTKLRTLYKLNSEDPEMVHFHTCLYVLIRRYTTFFGVNENEGVTYHAAAPEHVFRFMNETFDVRQENFASPLNCYFRNFNSAFPDTDVFFGSLGSFFNFRPISGSFETGPPYTEEVMEDMANHLESLLASEEPLSFIVFVPDWRTPLTMGLEIMEKSKFLRADFVLEGGKHSYVVGKQHKQIERNFLLPFDTHVYVLQNEEGFKKWTPTSDKMEKFKRQFDE